MNKIFLIVKKKKVYIPLIIVLLVVGVFVFLNNNTNKNYETGLVVRSDFNEEVSVTGKVVAAEAVDLAFESSGKIVSIPAQVGVLVKKDQVLASLNGGDAYANLLNAQARLTSEQVQLEEMKKGARPEELKIAQDSYDQAKLTLEESINDAYIQADDAIRGKTDMLFTDAENSYPVFITIQDYYFKQDIEDQRAGFTKILEDWRDKGATVTEAKAHLALINSYLKA
jgi:multidrug efflux pump subunit AcrA (membrane-fusion protein)